MLRKTLAFALLLPLLGCSSAVDVAPGPAPTPADLSAGCRGLYDAFGVWSSACDGPVLDPTSRDGLVTRCQERAALPGIAVSPAALGACAEQIAASTCAALPLACLTPHDAGQLGVPTDVWLGTASFGRYELFPRVLGTLEAGAGCDLAEQCQSGRCGDDAETCGVCVDVKRPGEACGATAVCDYGSNCTDAVCVLWGGGPGAACQAPKGSSSCQRGLHCPDGFCVPRHAVGESCAGEVPDFESCVEGAVCDAGVCQTIVTVHAGDACDVANLCEEGTFCTEDGKCRAPLLDVGVGGTCGVDVCAAGLGCNYGVCAPAALAGSPCSIEVPCGAGLVCFQDGSGRVCDAPRTEGGACTSPTDCAGGFFCSGGNAEGVINVCHRELDAGQPCDAGYCRASLSCSGGVCAALGACSAP
jgi:hypothetical protein